VYKHSSNRRTRYEDFFCLTPIGVRVGYASPKLVRLAPHRQQKRLRGRVVWASTANPFYAIAGIRAGATLSAAQAKLPKGNLFHIGLNDWYLAPVGSVTAIFKVRQGVVQEIGISDKALTRTPKTQRSFLTSFY
jgi:inactivated superfamily I helicase